MCILVVVSFMATVYMLFGDCQCMSIILIVPCVINLLLPLLYSIYSVKTVYYNGWTDRTLVLYVELLCLIITQNGGMVQQPHGHSCSKPHPLIRFIFCVIVEFLVKNLSVPYSALNLL